jgi:hypothetical protein
MRTDKNKSSATSKGNDKTRAAGALLAALAAASMLSIGGLNPQGTNAAYADDGNGLVIPMYGWDSGFDDVVEAKQDNPGTEMIVIINPSNGAGGSEESHWSNVVDDLQDEDIEVVGYVSTAYAGRSTGDVADEIDRYFDWYGVDGIFFDEVSPSAHEYYEDLYDHVDDEGGMVILNPGAAVPESYDDVADIIMVYENHGVPSGVTSNGISESKLGALPYGVGISESEFDDLSDEVGYLYVSPDWLSLAPSIEDQADWAD